MEGVSEVERKTAESLVKRSSALRHAALTGLEEISSRPVVLLLYTRAASSTRCGGFLISQISPRNDSALRV
jgi:hypothetical protein